MLHRSVTWPLLAVTVLVTSLVLVSGRKHRTFEDSCGGDDTCDKNKGLYCDVDKKICLCSEAASWIKEYDNEYKCRVMAGKKCGRSLTSPRCEKGLHCEAVKEGELAETICKCPEGQSCLETKHGGTGDDDNGGASSIFKHSAGAFGSLMLLFAHFFLQIADDD